jgi:chorismate mutase/prephenate dehydrogenase
VLAQMKIWGTRIERVTADEHDRAMSFIQALRHFTTYAYGYYLQKYRVDLDRLVQLSSPIYRLELMLVGRLFAQDPSLYADIILSSERNVENIMAYRDCIDEQVKMVQSYSRESFIREFLNIRDYFGSYSQQFLKESKILLDQARDSMVHNTL